MKETTKTSEFDVKKASYYLTFIVTIAIVIIAIAMFYFTAVNAVATAEEAFILANNNEKDIIEMKGDIKHAIYIGEETKKDTEKILEKMGK